MDITNHIVKIGDGKHQILDKKFFSLLHNKLDEDEFFEEKIEIYTIAFNEILDYNGENCFKEIKYRVTGGENMNIVLLEFLNNIQYPELHVLTIINKIQEFYDIEWLKELTK